MRVCVLKATIIFQLEPKSRIMIYCCLGFGFIAGDSLHCPPLDRAYKSKPLAHYPEHVPWNPFDAHGICMLSLPQGLRFRTQKHSIEPHFHSFASTVCIFFFFLKSNSLRSHYHVYGFSFDIFYSERMANVVMASVWYSMRKCVIRTFAMQCIRCR